MLDEDRRRALEGLALAAGDLDDSTLEVIPEPLAKSVKQILHNTKAGSYECTEVRYNLVSRPDRFVAVNPNAGILWPGALIRGASVKSGALDPIRLDRGPGQVVLDLNSGAASGISEKLDMPSHASVTTAINKLLGQYLEVGGSIPAKFSHSLHRIHSQEELRVRIGGTANVFNAELDHALAFGQHDVKSRVLVRFNQEYFTVVFTPEGGGASSFFAPTVTADQLENYAAPGDPPAYVASVTYGRMFYLLFESSDSSDDLYAALSGSYNGLVVGVGGGINSEWKKVINESTVRAYGLGGDAAQAIGAAVGADQFEKVRNALIEGAQFSRTSIGVPISYVVRYVANDQQMRVAVATEFSTREDCLPIGDLGCDGVPHSGMKVDQCGRCGGDGLGCGPCTAATVRRTHEHATWVNFTLPDAPHGKEVAWHDGRAGRWMKGLCRQVYWSNIAFLCQNGVWVANGETGYNGLGCRDFNASQPGLMTFAN